MTTYQMRHLKSFSESEVLPSKEIYYYRRRNQNRVYGAIAKLYQDLASQGKMNQKKLAVRLGKQPAVINRLLSDPSNLTLDTISDLLLAMNAEVEDYRPVFFEDRPAPNYKHQWQDADQDKGAMKILVKGSNFRPSGSPADSGMSTASTPKTTIPTLEAVK